jgi:hypothetical protein
MLGALLMGVLGVAAMPAHAAPYAGQHRYVDTFTVAIQGADGATWRVEVAARVAGAVQSEADVPLLITLDRCTGKLCAVVGRWRAPLTTGHADVAQDLSAGVIDTVTMGLPVRVSLLATTQLPTGNSVQFGYETGDPSHVHPRADYGKSATGTLTIGKLSCKVTSGTLGEAVVRVDTNGPNGDLRTAPPAAWPAGMLGPRATC